MALDSTIARSRRAVLSGAAGGLAAVVVHALGHAAPALAADGDIVKVGGTFTGTSATTIRNTSPAAGEDGIIGRSSSSTGAGVHGTNSGGGDAILGTATGGVGIHAKTTTGIAVVAENSGDGFAISAVAVGNSPTIQAAAFGTAPALQASSTHAPAIVAYGGGGRPAVLADVTTGSSVVALTGNAQEPAAHAAVVGVSTSAHGGYFASASGTALRAVGRLSFSRGGRFTVATAISAKTVSLTGVRHSSYVLATIQTNHAGLWIQSVVPGTDKFTIHFNKPTPSDTVVGYLAIN